MNDEYYIHLSVNDDNHPLIEGQDDEARMGEFHGIEIDLTQFDGDPLRLRLGKPVPKKPEMVDFHTEPHPVVSAKIRDVIEPLGLFRVQFVPATVVVKKRAYPYWVVNNYNRIACVDEKRSVVQFDSAHVLLSITKLVLDDEVLSKIPLERRLYFVLKEDVSLSLMHRTVMDAVMATKPVGIRFVATSELNDASLFG